jgi:tRNA pseudouridine38-40 synthase
MAVAMTVAYDGGGFQGFQWQPGVPTVQGALEAALALVSGGPVRILGASRTDAGVHAMGQVVVWPVDPCPIPLERVAAVVNRRLPPTVRVRQVYVVPASFDPRRSRAKTYSYRVVREPVVDPFWVRRVAVTAAPLSLTRLNALAALFLGRHDFAGFRHQGSSARTTIRQIFSAYWEVRSSQWVFWVTGDGFLYHMVRLMVGAMLDAAERGSDARIREALAAGGPARFSAAPASGLSLEQVWF